MTDSKEKLCGLVNEFDRVSKSRKLHVNVGRSKVMRCSRYANVGQMNTILADEALTKGTV